MSHTIISTARIARKIERINREKPAQKPTKSRMDGSQLADHAITVIGLVFVVNVAAVALALFFAMCMR